MEGRRTALEKIVHLVVQYRLIFISTDHIVQCLLFCVVSFYFLVPFCQTFITFCFACHLFLYQWRGRKTETNEPNYLLQDSQKSKTQAQCAEASIRFAKLLDSPVPFINWALLMQN
jgi:hypothetical protein